MERVEQAVQPWYKQGWPWFLMFFPALAVVAGFITLWLAITSFDGMVVDDYYKQGQAIDQEVDRTRNAAALGLLANVDLRAESVVVVLQGNPGVALPQGVLLTIVHPTRGGEDQLIALGGSNGRYEGRVAPLGVANWALQLEDEARTWRLNGSASLPTETQVRLQPVPPGPTSAPKPPIDVPK